MASPKKLRGRRARDLLHPPHSELCVRVSGVMAIAGVARCEMLLLIYRGLVAKAENKGIRVYKGMLAGGSACARDRRFPAPGSPVTKQIRRVWGLLLRTNRTGLVRQMPW
jgi:hypothetical protein